MYKDGDELLCKKSFRSFIKGKHYGIIHVEKNVAWGKNVEILHIGGYDNGKLFLEQLYTSIDKNVSGLYFDKNDDYLSFNEIFYTKEEVRKIKLERLNRYEKR